MKPFAGAMPAEKRVQYRSSAARSPGGKAAGFAVNSTSGAILSRLAQKSVARKGP
jgi:hypothetical protein